MALPLLLILVIIIGAALAVVWAVRAWKSIAQNQRRLEWLASRQFVVLMIEVPRLNDKTPLAAEQMFASLHGIQQVSQEFQEHIGFEIVAQGSHIRFYVFCPVHLRDFIEGQIYAQYPSVEIVKVDDYSRAINLDNDHIVGTELEMTKPDVYPIKTFVNFTVDPLAGITAPLGKMGDSDQVWIQVLVRPVDDSWQARGVALVKSIREGKKTLSLTGSIVGEIASFAFDTIREAASPGSLKPAEKGSVDPTKLSGPTESALKGVEEKITKLGFATKIRIMAVGADIYSAQSKVMSVVGAFKQFNTTNLNGFTAKQMIADSRELWDKYTAREFEDKGLVLNIEELASLYHLPNITVETPNIVWTRAKKGEPPSNLPLVGVIPANEITKIGVTNFRNSEKEFGITLTDRRRHIYTIGKSGTGKSTLLENMIVDDIHEGRGVVLVDPHGDFYERVLANIPERRIDDVVLFDPADRMFPIGFNLLENVDEDLKGIIASGFVGIFEKMFSNSWGPRLEHILRNTVLALLDYPDSTMLGIPRMLTDKKFRAGVVEKVKDPVIKDFWENEFASWDAKFAAEAVAPILNKVGQFISASTIRNIVAQPKSSFNMRQIIDEGKILLINLSRGKIGEDNSAMLGAMMITKLQLAAMSRADIPEEQRTDCYLYVDEFQNFATRSFATILSEARKYHLDLTMANQYISQMPEEVRDAVFGNVGTIVAFRVGAGDASVLAHEFTPEFEENDLVNQDIHKIYIKLSINGLTGQSFSANTLAPHQSNDDFTERIVEQSRRKYSRERAEVEAEIGNRDFDDSSKPSKNMLLEEGTIQIPSIKLNPEHILNGVYYKELHSKGGIRWWEGEPIEAVIDQEEKKRQKYLAKKVEHIKSGKLLGLNEIGDMSEFDDLPAKHADVKHTTPVMEQGSGEAPLRPPMADSEGRPSYSNKQSSSPQELQKEVIREGSQSAPYAGSYGAPSPALSKKNDLEQGSDSTSYAKATEGHAQSDLKISSEEGSRAPLRPPRADYEGWLKSGAAKEGNTSSLGKIVSQEGIQPGERGQTNYSATNVPKPTEAPAGAQTSITLSEGQKSEKNSDSESFQAPNPSSSALMVEQPEPTAIIPAVHAQNDLVVAPDHAPKAPQAPTSPAVTSIGTNQRPHSILQHFLDKKEGNNQAKASVSGAHDSAQAPIAPHSNSNDPLEEGVPYAV